MSAFISHIGTAVPANQILQSDVSEYMRAAHGFVNGSEVKLKALYRSTGIKTRYSVLTDFQGVPSLFPQDNLHGQAPGTAERLEVYQREAKHLAYNAICDAVPKDFDYSKVTDLITVSCTGLYAPGLDFDLITMLDLPHATRRTAINYMGCYAAISATRLAQAIVSQDQNAVVLLVCVELCSLHFQKEATEDNQLANALFGDGAAAMVVQGNPIGSSNLRIDDFSSQMIPEGQQDMAWNIGNLGFEMKLSSYVPQLISTGVAPVLEGLDISSFSHFALHPGGKRILDVLEEKLDLLRSDTWHSREVLRYFGNMSSPTILFVLKAIVDTLDSSNTSERILGMAFGPGLTIERMSITYMG